MGGNIESPEIFTCIVSKLMTKTTMQRVLKDVVLNNGSGAIALYVPK